MESEKMDYLQKRKLYMDYSEAFEMEKWIDKVPTLTFKEHWQVKIRPPFLGAIIRFSITTDKGSVSVYLDAHDMLGSMGKPYWEVYDGEDCIRFYFEDHKEMMQYVESILG